MFVHFYSLNKFLNTYKKWCRIFDFISSEFRMKNSRYSWFLNYEKLYKMHLYFKIQFVIFFQF